MAALPAGVTVCGDGWGVQEDQANGDASVFTGKPAPTYPDDYRRVGTDLRGQALGL